MLLKIIFSFIILWQSPVLPLQPEEDYYEIMELNVDATNDEIEKKYQELVQKFAIQSKRIDKIKAAYEVLHSPEKRKKYDETPQQIKRKFDSLTEEWDAILDNMVKRKDKAILEDEAILSGLVKKIADFIKNNNLSSVHEYNDLFLKAEGLLQNIKNLQLGENIKQRINEIRSKFDQAVASARQQSPSNFLNQTQIIAKEMGNIVGGFYFVDQSLREHILDILLELYKKAEQAKETDAIAIQKLIYELANSGPYFPVNPKYMAAGIDNLMNLLQQLQQQLQELQRKLQAMRH